MSKLTNWGENKLVDYYIRKAAWSIPASWYLGLASAASDSAVTELAGSGYARQPLNRNLNNWSGTQGLGSTLASTGTTHRTSNNASINFGTSPAVWGVALYGVLYDAPTGGNAFIYADLETPLDVQIGTQAVFDVGALLITIGLTGGMSDYLSNKVIDELFRGQSFTKPDNLYGRLLTGSPSNAGGGTEVNAISYSRVAIPRSLTAWAGTQAPGSTTASSGTSGETSNNNDILWPTPESSWGTVGWAALNDAAVAGNLWFWGAMVNAKSVTSTSPPPNFPAGDFRITFS